MIPPKPPLPTAPEATAPEEPDAAPDVEADVAVVEHEAIAESEAAPTPTPAIEDPEPEAVVADPEPVPVVSEPEPMPAIEELEPMPAIEELAPEPALEEPEPIAAEPVPVVAEPEPMPVVAEPEPIAAEPEAVIAEPEPPQQEAAHPELEALVTESPVAPEYADPFAASVVLEDAPAAAPPVLVLRGVTKSFGDTRAVDGIDLTVPAGTFYGIVGPNGAGKTTTLSLIAGLLRPDKGSIAVGGVNAKADPTRAKRVMGVLPDRLRTFDRLTGRQLLYYYGVLRGLPSATVESRIADLARAFDLTEALGRSVSDYSAGMSKKVMLAGALIHSPRLLVLDEPFEAVDPVSSAVILDILSAYVAHGGTVILSSHGMEFVERVCTRVAVIVAGQVLAEGTVDEVRGELTLEQRFVELAGGLSDVEGLEWLHTFSD
ncbi:ATP-binding cassette domain-containing protein [Microbacterium sp. NPDC019599]|uniref:ABC transporter ATP-binding protein n=1 Tax=Microbacterium sp. NPDC019599 TaxID=3154690 RepID=UPI0033C18AB0